MANVATLLTRHLNRPQTVLYSSFMEGRWKDFTAHDLVQLATRCQHSFRHMGLQTGDRIALCLRNSMPWVALDQAALGMGLVVVPLFVDDNAENIIWCLKHCEARLLVLENTRLLKAVHKELGALPVVCLESEGEAPALTWNQWLKTAPLQLEVRDLQPGSTATIVYTSGTTGQPKGVTLSHGNILSNVESVARVIAIEHEDIFISLLPLSHMLERTGGYYLPLFAGCKVVFARGINQLAQDLATQMPTVIIAVPRLFERFLARIEQNLARSPVKRLLFGLTVQLGWDNFIGKAGGFAGWMARLLQRTVGKSVLNRLGGKLRVAVVGGAALDQRIAKNFIGMGLPLLQGYGLTETSPVVSVNRLDDNDPASVGLPLPGIEVRLSDKQELLVRGPGIMQGYWQNPDATRSVLDLEGWLNTGDVADIRAGKIYIKGRTKEILVLSNGEKCPPQDVEHAVLSDSTFEQVMLLGEGKPYLALLAVTSEHDEKKLVRLANARLTRFPRYMRIHRVIAVQEPWTLENGLLTPTLKVKRNRVYDRYRDRIDAAYRELP